MTSIEKPWHEAFPQPKNTSPEGMTREGLLLRLQHGEIPGKDFLLVDLRRNDHEGGTIRGSVNLPAQSLYYSLPTVLELCQNAGVSVVIWYCGSSRGRGTRAAGWFDDLIQERGVKGIKSVILLGGITGWAKAGEEFTSLMDGYDSEVWRLKG